MYKVGTIGKGNTRQTHCWCTRLVPNLQFSSLAQSRYTTEPKQETPYASFLRLSQPAAAPFISLQATEPYKPPSPPLSLFPFPSLTSTNLTYRYLLTAINQLTSSIQFWSDSAASCPALYQLCISHRGPVRLPSF
ncbi:hypothetical protein GE21DRAFT_1037857 [Neurospora crassa]|nr:hypothetical protein GE21DRAFT_1037857 [Neurospora crassa]